MGSLLDELVRAVVGDVLRRSPWTHGFLCVGCLLSLTLAEGGLAYGDFEVRRAIERMFRKPGDFVYMPAFRCAKCDYVMACLGAK